MTEPSPHSDTNRLTVLSVHIPCGQLRGPVAPLRQSCRCERNPVVWPGRDVSRQFDLCAICQRATAGGTSRWSWLACENCRAINSALWHHTGVRPFALGRHSIMNGIAARGGQPPEQTQRQLAELLTFARGDHRLHDWRHSEFRRLAAVFDAEDVPLTEWHRRWPPGEQASLEAFSRLLGIDGVAMDAVSPDALRELVRRPDVP